jgi:hypothetical protein
MTASFMLWAWPYVVAIGGVITVLAATWFGGRKSAKTDAKMKQSKANEAAQERMNNVDQMRDATDGQRVERLRQFERDNRP